MRIKNILPVLLVVSVSLTNYKLAKIAQGVILNSGLTKSYILSLATAWFLIGAFAALIFWRESGLVFAKKLLIRNLKKILLLIGLVSVGLVIFVLLGVTKYFHDVKFPIIFFLVTPIIEELIFRGTVYGYFEKIKLGNPVVVSSVLFGLHHLQYFNYQLSLFALFQIIYTFFLGLLLGKTRKLSGSIYVGIFIHILINYLTLKF